MRNTATMRETINQASRSRWEKKAESKNPYRALSRQTKFFPVKETIKQARLVNETIKRITNIFKLLTVSLAVLLHEDSVKMKEGGKKCFAFGIINR